MGGAEVPDSAANRLRSFRRISDQSKCARLTYSGYESKSERLRTDRDRVRVRAAVPPPERGCPGRSPYRVMPGVPARVGEPPTGGQSVCLLAHRCAAADDVA